MTDEKSDAFGIPFTPPDRPQSVVRYLNTAHVKVDLAEWHRMRFEEEENALTKADFFRGGNDPFLPAQAHADGVVLQLGGAFDSFGCAVAHRTGVAYPDRASFDTKNAKLAAAAGGELGAQIRLIREGTDYRGLLAYRHLAAHRGGYARTIARERRS